MVTGAVIMQVVQLECAQEVLIKVMEDKWNDGAKRTTDTAES